MDIILGAGSSFYVIIWVIVGFVFYLIPQCSGIQVLGVAALAAGPASKCDGPPAFLFDTLHVSDSDTKVPHGEIVPSHGVMW